MRVFRLAVQILSLLATVGSGSLATAQSARDIAEYASPSIVLIVSENSRGKTLGTGFCVLDNIVATNYHVIRGATKQNVKVIASQEFRRIEGIIAVDRKKDLALLRVWGLNAPPLLIGDSSQSAVGDEVYAVGNPAGLEGTFPQGIISGVREIAGNQYLQITAPISGGSSGGPILNKSGGVIGIAVGTLNVGQNLNFGIPVSELKALLERTPGLDAIAEQGISGNGKKLVLDLSGLCYNEAKLTREYRANPKSAPAVFKLAEEFRRCHNARAAVEGYEILLRLKPGKLMNPILEQIKSETAERLAARARERRLSVDDYLRSLLSPANRPAEDEEARMPPRNEEMLAVLRRSSERLKNMPVRGSTEETLQMIRDARAGRGYDYVSSE